MANAMCNSDNEDDIKSEDKPKKSFKKSIKISKSVNEILDEKKEKAKRKRLKRLQEQKMHCLDGDKFSNEDDRIRYEESSNVMVRAIAFLEEKESENFFKQYICDIQRAFGQGLEKTENSEKSSKFDKNFEGSCLKKDDFRFIPKILDVTI